jgi:hypothetical protein
MTVTPQNGGPVQTYHSIQTMSYVTPALHGAEWMVENPGGGPHPLASFTPITFTGAWATIAGQTGGINRFQNAQAWNISSSEGTDLTTNPPINTNTPGYNEARHGFSSSIFQVNWIFNNQNPGGGSGGSGVGGGGLGGGGGTKPNIVFGTPVTGLGQGPGIASSSFFATPATQVAPREEGFSTLGVPSHEGLMPTKGGSHLGSTAAVDAVFAQDGLDNQLLSPTAVDDLFSLEGLGSHHHNELLW